MKIESTSAQGAPEAGDGLAHGWRGRVPGGWRRMQRQVQRAGAVLATVLVLLGASVAPAASSQRKSILLLNSYHLGFAWTDTQVEGILAELRGSDLGPDLFIEHMDALRQRTPYPDDVERAYLEARYQGRKFDLVMTTDDDALAFVVRHHARLFPGMPVVFSDAAAVDIEGLRKTIPVTGVRERLDVRATLELARRLRPLARQIVVFANRGDRGSGVRHARDALDKLQPGIPIVVHEDLKLDEIAATAAALSADDIVFPLASALDERGVWHDHTDVIVRIGEVSRAPMFDITGHRVRRGLTLGGRVEDGLEVGHMAARLALRILRGEDAARVPVEEGPLVNLFSYAQMQRHGIAAASLPAGHTIVGKPPSLYEQHRVAVWAGAAALLGMGLAIVGLSANVRTRRRAEQSLRSNEERLRLALEAGELGFYDLDLVTGEATVSPEYTRMLGYEAGEPSLDLRTWTDLIHPEDRERARSTLGACIEGQQRQYRIEYRLRAKTGEWVWIQSVGKIVAWDAAGRAQRMLGTHADITARKQSEQLLELMRLSVECGSDAVFWANGDGSLAYVNEQACQSLGYSRAELLRLRLWQVDAEVPETAWGGIWEQLCREGQYHRETRHRRKDGSVVPVVISARAISHDGRTYAIGIAHDITERKLAEATLIQSEERLRQAVRVSGIGIFDHDPDAGRTYWSPDLRRTFGWAPEASIDLADFIRVVHAEDRAAVEAAIAHSQDPAGDGQYRVDYRILKPDGEVRWIMAIGQTFFEGEGADRHPVRGVGATLDITESKRSDEALRESEARLRTAVESVPFDFFLIGADGRYVLQNSAGRRHWGDVVGKLPEEATDDPVLLEHWQSNNRRALGGELIEEDTQFVSGGKARYIHNIIAPIVDGGRVLGVLGLNIDITERKAVEAALIDLNATLEQRVAEEVARSREKDHLLIQQSRLAAMGEMIGNIAHQWRQPINALALLLTNISDAHQYGELTRDYLDAQVGKGHKLIQRMSSTIDDFRNFFRPNRQPQPFLISSAVKAALSIVESAFANHHIGIVFTVHDEAVSDGFANEYTQVLLNLLSNAKEAIEGRGRTPGRVDISLQADETVARLTVRDNGGGIPADILPKIFDPYFTTRDHGTGIGLYMSKMIIETNMSGRIEAVNGDAGAQFTIVTPLAPGDKPSDGRNAEPVR